MNSPQARATAPPRVHATLPPDRTRYFYSGAAALILVLMLLGFQQYYLYGKAFPDRDIARPLKSLILLHASAMTGWVVLFLVQPLLIAGRNYRAHRVLGTVAALLAAFIVGVGLTLSIIVTRHTPPEVRIWGVTPTQFMIVPFATVLLFGICVASGVIYRRRPDIHRPLMLTATLIAIPAAVARIAPLNDLYHGTAAHTIFGPFLWTLVVATVLFAVKSALTRSLDRPYALSYGSLVASSLLIWQLATTAAWERFASLML